MSQQYAPCGEPKFPDQFGSDLLINNGNVAATGAHYFRNEAIAGRGNNSYNFSLGQLAQSGAIVFTIDLVNNLSRHTGGCTTAERIGQSGPKDACIHVAIVDAA